MVYYKDNIKQNNAERATGVAVKTLSFDMAGEAGLADGDIITVGSLPLQSLTTGLSVIVPIQFDGDTPTFQLGYYNRTTKVFVAMTGDIILSGAAGKVIRVPLISDTTNVNDDGTAYTGETDFILNDDHTAIAIEWGGGAVSPTVGECTILLHHDYFGVATAKYGCDNTPMSVYSE